jgi:hypothetical protein
VTTHVIVLDLKFQWDSNDDRCGPNDMAWLLFFYQMTKQAAVPRQMSYPSHGHSSYCLTHHHLLLQKLQHSLVLIINKCQVIFQNTILGFSAQITGINCSNYETVILKDIEIN